jgi:hypothetical protein
MTSWKFPWIAVLQVAGLIATGYVVWVGAVAPRLQFESVGAIVLSAFLYAGIAGAFSAGLTLLLCGAFLGWNAEAAFRMALRTARTAVWFAPACILVSHLSPAALLPAVALIFGTTQMLYAEWARARQPLSAEAFQRPDSEPFALLPAPAVWRVMALPLITAIVLQAAVSAQMMKYHLPAAGLFSAAVALGTLLLLGGGVLEAEQSRPLPRAVFGVILTLILAAGLTAVHVLVRYHQGLPGWGAGGETVASTRNPFDSLRELMRRLLPPEGGDADEEDPQALREQARGKGPVEAVDEVFPGIVLVAEEKPYTLLVAPSPSWLKASIPSIAAQSYSIPFSGEYWMFRPPFKRPPRGARYQTGDPVKLSFKTNDQSRMLMEARQRLDRTVALTCCDAIRVQVMNGDRFPGTISVELELIRHLPEGEMSASLGQAPLTVWPVTRGREPPSEPVSEVIEFPVPGAAAIQEFDELRLILHRHMVRYDRSARVSIERFILIPRQGG